MMKTKLMLLFAAVLTLGSLSSCVVPYGPTYGYNNYRRPYYGGLYNNYYRPGYVYSGYRSPYYARPGFASYGGYRPGYSGYRSGFTGYHGGHHGGFSHVGGYHHHH